MTLFDWLLTAQGQALAHALELLVLAFVAFLTAWTNRVTHANSKLLNGHLRDHLFGSGDEKLLRERRIPDDR